MTKKITISLIAVILIMSMLFTFVACKKDEVVPTDPNGPATNDKGEYGNLPIKLELGADNSIPRMTGDVTYEAMKNNPNRGFAINAAITLDNISSNYKDTFAFPTKCSHPEHSLASRPITTSEYINQEFEKYKAYSPRVVELTVYLTNFLSVDLSDFALEQLYGLLRDTFRYNGISVVLKFAYAHENEIDKVPVETIVKHAEKIGIWLNSGANNIAKNTLSAIKLSFIGIDGNFEDIRYSNDELKVIVDAFSKMVPDNSPYSTQAPNVIVKNMSDNYSQQIRTGFFNNNIDGTINSSISGGIDKKSDIYKQYVYQSMSNYNSASVVPNKSNIDGKAVLKVLKDGYFATFNIANMFPGDQATKSLITKWQETYITKKDLDTLNLPYYDEWFLNSDGTSANRSVFDYIRDFSGYNLSLTNLKLEKYYKQVNGVSKIHTKITFVITNYGMSAPFGIDRFEVFLKSNATGAMLNGGKPLTYAEYDISKLGSGGQILITQEVLGDIDVAEGANLSAEDKAKGHSIGVRVYQKHSPKDQYVRLSNAVPYENNIHWIYNTIA